MGAVGAPQTASVDGTEIAGYDEVSPHSKLSEQRRVSIVAGSHVKRERLHERGAAVCHFAYDKNQGRTLRRLRFGSTSSQSAIRPLTRG